MKTIAGNWKMNGTAEMLRDMTRALSDIKTDNRVIICPPFTLLCATPHADTFAIGAQDCSAHDAGAFTGEVSAKMVADTGAKYVIVGHSERRAFHSETNEMVAEKAARALENGLTPIICVGETLDQREEGRAYDVVAEQLAGSIPMLDMTRFTVPDFIIAYEPVWAIGTGRAATTDDILKMHAHMRTLTPANLLYGGSVKAANAAEIMNIPNVDGVLVGGASLKPDDFLPIIMAA